MAFDFNFDPEKMKQDSEDAQNEKAMLKIAGAVGQGFQTPSAYELLTGKKIDRPDIKGSLDSIASDVQDPSERQGKLYQAYKQAKDAEKVQNESADDAKLRDPNSVFSQYSRNRAKADGHSVDETMSANDVMKFYDAKKMDEIKANSAVDFQKQKSLHEMQNRSTSKEKALDRQNDMDKIMLSKSLEAGKKSDPLQRMQALSGTDKARLDNALMVLKGIDGMGSALDKGQNTYSAFGDNDYTTASRAATEGYGRMQSGGAINKEEEARFEKTLPGVTDSKEIQRKKLLSQRGEMLSRLKTLGFSPEDLGYKPQEFAYGGGDQKSLAGDMVKTAQAGTAPGPRIVKKEFNQKLNKTRITLDDGSTQEIEGRQ